MERKLIMSKEVLTEKIFYKLEAKAEDWTGYDPVVVDDVVKTGLSLIEENKKLKERDDYASKERRETGIKWFFGILGGAIGTGVAIFGLWALITFTGTKPEEFLAEYNKGYTDGQWAKVEGYIIDDIKTRYNPGKIVEIIIEREIKDKEDSQE